MDSARYISRIRRKAAAMMPCTRRHLQRQPLGEDAIISLAVTLHCLDLTPASHRVLAAVSDMRLPHPKSVPLLMELQVTPTRHLRLPPPDVVQATDECPVCFEPPTTFLPCGHYYCRMCPTRLRACAVCRRPIDQKDIYPITESTYVPKGPNSGGN